MTERPRDWDKELADIDKVIAKSPAPAAPGRGSPPTVQGGGGRMTAPVSGGRFPVFTTWLRVGLGLLLAVAITQWPYHNACGFNLAVYFGAIVTVVVAGAWSSITSWQRRLGFAHFLSLLVLLWGLVLTAREVLPRVGYARHARTWSCDAGVEAP
ncbi:MAG: hypothetical protein ABI742_06610 [Gemmatimonadota bacterium]